MAKWLLAQMTLPIGPGLPVEGIMIHLESGKPEDAAANKVMEAFLKTDCTHIMKMDNDIMADIDLIRRLLAHDKDVVGVPVTVVQERGIVTCGCWIDENQITTVPDITPPNNKLIGPIDFVGGGCVLIKRKVIETLRKDGPIYVTTYGNDGQVSMYCDNYLMKNVKKAKFEAWLDATEVLGQVVELNLMQAINPDSWPRVKPKTS